MSAEELYKKREDLKTMIREQRWILEEARKLHESLYEKFKKLSVDYEKLEREIAEMEGKITVISPRKRPTPIIKTVNHAEALKAAMAGMTEAERQEFINDLLG